MAETSWSAAIPEAIIILGVVVRIIQGKAQTKEIKTAQENAANSTRLKIESEEALTREQVIAIVSEYTGKFVAKLDSQADRDGQIDRSITTLNQNVKRLCAVNGIEWKDDVTVVPDHTKK